MDNLVDFICETDADVMLLQEVRSSDDSSLEPRLRTMQYFREIFEYPYDNFTTHYRDFDDTEGLDYHGNAIFSRFEILSSSVHFINREYTEEYRDVPGNYHNAPLTLDHHVLTLTDGPLHAFNLHGPVDLDGDQVNDARIRMRDAIVTGTAGCSPLVLAGDTNAKSTNPIFEDLAGLHSVFGTSLTTTFNMRRKHNPGYATAAVDAMFVSDGVGIVSKRCPDVDVSDHLPLVVVLDV